MTEPEAMEKPKKTAKKTSKKHADEGVSAVGRRKTAIARVKLSKGEGAITINGYDYLDYVANRHRLIAEIHKPFVAVNINNLYNVDVKANGGGVSSQAEAVKLGIARALIIIDPSMKPALSKAGCLVRDSRMKERKKYGQKRARKRFQFSKR